MKSVRKRSTALRAGCSGMSRISVTKRSSSLYTRSPTLRSTKRGVQPGAPPWTASMTESPCVTSQSWALAQTRSTARR